MDSLSTMFCGNSGNFGRLLKFPNSRFGAGERVRVCLGVGGGDSAFGWW